MVKKYYGELQSNGDLKAQLVQDPLPAPPVPSVQRTLGLSLSPIQAQLTAKEALKSNAREVILLG